MPCQPGSFNDGTSKSCTSCPSTKYCPNTTSANGGQQTCPDGTYSTGAAFYCLQCPPGSACTGGNKSTCNGTGQYSLAGATVCETYTAGTEQNSLKTAAPAKCPQGYYTSGTTCKICDKNYYCDGATRQACTGGSLCPEGTASQGTCPDYQDCASYTNACSYGQKWNGSACVACPKDKVCPLRGGESNVSTGYYSPVNHNVEFICPGGYDCTNANNVVKCDTGAYSPEGTLACTDCPGTHACPHPELGLAQQIDCTNLRGYYQPNGKQTKCTICPAGSECPYGVNTITPCDPGTWSLPGMEFCHVCPKGYECPSTAKPLMNYCLTGTFSTGKQNACTICPEGYECVGSLKKACAANKWSSKGDGICKFFEGGFAGFATGKYDGSGIVLREECP